MDYKSGKNGDQKKSSLPIIMGDENIESDGVGPIEAAMLTKLKKLNGCKYPDNFDWSVYDKISERFKDGPPRGGVVFNTTLKLANFHSSCSKCHYSLELDTYGRGCTHNCVYCYAKDQLNSHGYWNRPFPFPVNIADIRKIFYTVFETSKPSKWREVLEKRIPLRIGSMSDSFMWIDVKYGVTKEVLKILNFYNYPYVIFTRSDLVAHDDYLKLIRPDLASVQLSICGGNELLTKLIEPGAISVSRRLLALKKLKSAHVRTAVRINPLFPMYPDGYFSDHENMIKRFGGEEIPSFDFFGFDFIDRIAEAGVDTVLAGFVRLSSWSIKNISSATGVDLKRFFLPEVIAENSDKHFSDKEIGYYYRAIHRKCRENGLRFTTCYIGNGIKDYYQYQSLWSNREDCCDVKGFVKSFDVTSQDISWDVRIKQAPNKQQALNAMTSDLVAEREFTGRVRATSVLSLVQDNMDL
jgi:DNA repair photolyase